MSKMFVMLIRLHKNIIIFKRIIFFFLYSFSLCYSFAFAADDYYRGVNLSGLELGREALKKNNYVVPTEKHYKYWFGQDSKMNIIRLPFLWERIQPELFKPLDTDYLYHLKTQIALAKKYNVTLILDMHNMARYNLDPPKKTSKKHAIGTQHVPKQAFIDVWIRLGMYFKNHENIIFGLMNEPMHDHAPKRWADINQELIDALRKRKINNILLVSPISFSAAHNWYDVGNAAAFEKIHDPINKTWIEIHQYFDYFFDGHLNGKKDQHLTFLDDAVSYLYDVTEWAKKHDHKLLLGETGLSFNADNIFQNSYEMSQVLTFLEDRKDVWKGYLLWGAGAGWPHDYPLKLTPRFDKDDNPIEEQLEILWYKDFIARR